MAQMVATLQVYLSNLALHEKMSLIAQAGYLTVPNQKILPTLNMIAPAFYGGVFFTLSIGIGISLISFVCVWTWKHVCHLKRGFLPGFIGLWVVSIILLNWHGFVLMPTLHAILIPAVVVTLFLLLSPNDMGKRTRMALLLHFLSFSLLVLLWSTQMSNTLYVNIRDNLLLSNAPGIRFNDLYYQYTLYPAEVFRNLNQKLIKTYHLLETSDSQEQNRLKQKLRNYDYLPISENGKSDVQIEMRKNRIRLTGNRQTAIEMELDDFFKNTRKALGDLSKSNDTYIHFRAATSISLLVGFPLILYWIFNGLLVQCFSLFLGKQPAIIAGVIACFLIGILLLLLMPTGHKRDIPMDSLPGMLASNDWKNRVAALQYIDSNKIDLQQFDLTRNLSQHASIPVRYWLARSLSVGKHPDDEAHLIMLMQDPHPNVACQALYSIGKRKFRKVTARLLETIKDSDHWYVQLYTYNSLRKLGWKQSISN